MDNYSAIAGALKTLIAAMKDPDRIAMRLILLGWGCVATYGVAALVHAIADFVK